MDALWHAIEVIFEWIFAVAKPIGRITNILFIAIGFIGTFFWLWYDKQASAEGKNFMSEGPAKK